MADYYPLISRAVSGLDKNTGENRRALYDRARVALVDQLRGVQPALEESDITRERLALEEAIRKVEAETAKRARADAPEPEASPRCAIGACAISARPWPRRRASAVRRRRPNGAAHATYEAMPPIERTAHRSRTFRAGACAGQPSLRLAMRRRRPSAARSAVIASRIRR